MTHSLAANSLRGKLSLDKRTHQAERREHRRISKYLLLNHSDDGTIRNMEKQGPAILAIYCCQKRGGFEQPGAERRDHADIVSHRMMGGFQR